MSAAARYDTLGIGYREHRRPDPRIAAQFHAAMGDAKRAAEAIREARKPGSFWVSDVVLARDPWFDGVRGSKEFKALGA